MVMAHAIVTSCDKQLYASTSLFRVRPLFNANASQHLLGSSYSSSEPSLEDHFFPELVMICTCSAGFKLVIPTKTLP